MVEQYEVRTTSRQSATVSDRVLVETTTTRLVLRPEIIQNSNNPDATVRIALIHQRKSATGKWDDAPTKSLTGLKADEQVNFALRSSVTLELYKQLQNLYAIATKGRISYGKSKLVVGREEEVIQTNAGRARVIKLLLAKGYSDDIWKTLVDADPDLATQFSYARIHAERKKALEEYRLNLTQKRGEGWWQDFFEKNTWIFGYGLKYQILKSVQSQPSYGGINVAGKGLEKGDFLQRSEAEIKFTVLVEIKKPDSPLLGNKPYRNGAWQLGEELTGGISQIQANCRRWEVEGAQTERNREALQQRKIYTVQPKGILVVGTTGQLSSTEKRNTFELFRRNVFNPEILTFDELYARARYIVEHSSKNVKPGKSSSRPNDLSESGDDIPF
jgi:antiviral defense system Shedu protein SduA